jgi:hypothetical protein
MTPGIAASAARPGLIWNSRGGVWSSPQGNEPPHRAVGVRDPAEIVQLSLVRAVGQDPHQGRLTYHGAKQVAGPG